MTVQISFLGKARHDAHTGYRKVIYRLDEATTLETPFFGLALASHRKPDRLILLGTPGSMWDVLLEADLDKAVCDEECLELLSHANAGTVDETLLGRFEPMISERIGVPCELRVISYGSNNAEQAEMVQRLAGWLNAGDEVVFDVTHGLRHLPMLMLAAAHYLEKLSQVKVTEIFYAALDMTPEGGNGNTPVLRLSGLLRMLDWVQAFAAYDKDGDYSVFSGLLSSAGTGSVVGDCLRNAAFMERTSRDGQAKHFIERAIEALSQHRLAGIAELFEKPLRNRLAWVQIHGRFNRQRELARIYLERQDFVRASIFAFEAVISNLVYTNRGNDSDYECREAARKQYLANGPRDFKILCGLRNALAHGIASTHGDVQQAMTDEKRLHSRLVGLIDRLLGNNSA